MNTRRLFSLPTSRLVMLLPVVLVAGCGSPEQSAQGYYESGMALIEKKDDLEARLELLKAVKYKSDKVEVWRALAGIDERTKANSLFPDLRRIVELDPNDLDARLKLARIMVAGGAADAALKVLDAAKEGEKPNAALARPEGDHSAADQGQLPARSARPRELLKSIRPTWMRLACLLRRSWRTATPMAR